MSPFQLTTPLSPQGDQSQAIEKLAKSILAGNRHQTLLGVTGSGKTFTMANLIARLNRPTLVLSHNKTLAAQLFSELRNFFPNNAVEYFVSYFDYYQPEAYLPKTDTYIEKDSAINDEIERLRLSTMGSLLTRKDVIVVASVSCIYGLGSPEDYANAMLPVRPGEFIDRDAFLRKLVALLYERDDFNFSRGSFRVRGEVVDVFPANLENTAVRVEFFGDEIDSLSFIDPTSGSRIDSLSSYLFLPAKQFVTDRDKLLPALASIREELQLRVEQLVKDGDPLAAERLTLRTNQDLEMLEATGICPGIENYSRHLTGRPPGSQPYTMLDFFSGQDYLTLIDESHVTIPQIRGMYEGDMSRKRTLVKHGFRLPSALDNRPLKFDEFMASSGQLLYVSATPAPFELINSRSDNKSWIPTPKTDEDGTPINYRRLKFRASGSSQPVADFNPSNRAQALIVEQIIRPTGLLDPVVTLRPLAGQIDETIALCNDRISRHQRVLVTTLTKKTAEDLTSYLKRLNLNVAYIHADVDAIERIEILRQLRSGSIDVLVGINLLREGLDLPEVSLVCILDADKEGFLRNDTSLIQTAGRAARHVEGECVLFCDTVTDSIQKLLDVTAQRRAIQQAYNEQHGITPHSVKRADQASLHQPSAENPDSSATSRDLAAIASNPKAASRDSILKLVKDLESEMLDAARRLEFEKAAHLRDQIALLKGDLD